MKTKIRITLQLEILLRFRLKGESVHLSAIQARVIQLEAHSLALSAGLDGEAEDGRGGGEQNKADNRALSAVHKRKAGDWEIEDRGNGEEQNEDDDVRGKRLRRTEDEEKENDG
jgi:hypothetical protein